MKVLITGATGLIGQEIVKLLHTENIHVNYLTTSTKKIQDKPLYKGFYWNPDKNEIHPDCIKDVDVIINLVGASVAKKWTASHKKQITDSRTKTAALLYNTLKNSAHAVKQIVSASAIGVYPDSLTNYYDETFKDIDSSFLGTVVQQWEDAVDAFKDLNILVTKIRIGIVLSNKGGALQEIVKPIKLGAGAALGTGKQWQSWVHIQDLANIFKYVINNNIEGIINGVAPNPVTNIELTKIAAQVLKRPLILPNVPKFVLKFTLGEMHKIAFSSQRVSSKKIENLGFQFKYHHLKPALENLL